MKHPNLVSIKPAAAHQAQTLAERVAKNPTGKNFDVSWAGSIEWRVVSPFVEFAWQIDEPLYDEAGLPRVLQVHELLDHLTHGKVPTESMVPLIKEVRKLELAGNWYQAMSIPPAHSNTPRNVSPLGAG
jgi:hypothetical protein